MVQGSGFGVLSDPQRSGSLGSGQIPGIALNFRVYGFGV